MPEDPDDFDSRPGCLPRVLRRFFGAPRPTMLGQVDDEELQDEDEDLQHIDFLERFGRISPQFAGCLRFAVVVLGLCVFTILGVLGMDIGDSTTIRVVEGSEVPGATDTTTTTTTEAPSSNTTPEVASVVGGYVHGTNKFGTPSRDQACAVVTGVKAGAQIVFSGSGGEGALTVGGTVGADGRVLAEGGISQFGTKTFTSGEVTDPSTGTQATIELLPPLEIDVQGGDSKPCDPADLPDAPADTTGNAGGGAATPPVEEPAAQGATVKITEETDGFPWSLVVAGGASLLLLAFAFGGGTAPKAAKTYPDFVDGPQVM